MKYAGLVVFPASDLAKEKAIFTALVGTEPYVDGDYYVGYRVDDVEVGLDPNAHQKGPIVYWDTDDIAASIEQLTSPGGQRSRRPQGCRRWHAGRNCHRYIRQRDWTEAKAVARDAGALERVVPRHTPP